MKEEVIRILKMVEEGKLTAEQAAKLLDAMGEALSTPKTGKFIKITVRDSDGDNVNITIPLGLVKFLSSFIPKDAKATLEQHEIDLNQLITTIEEGANGTIVDINSEDGDVVKISIE
ncbi:MAG: hypothetical protein QMD82_08245 [bacterium]|nr:hypothetical protein [bacterium]